VDKGRISTRYARALYDFALEKGEETKLYEEMKILLSQLSSFSSLHDTLKNPTVANENKIKLLTTAAGISVSNSYQSLSRLLVKNKREADIWLVALTYQLYYRRQKGMVVAQLTTAEAASDSLKEKLKIIIHQSLGDKKVDFINSVDPELIGGFVLKIDDYQLDASVQTQLYRLKKQLREVNHVN
jgi:F-type H+-transporting ATPase subunit delta